VSVTGIKTAYAAHHKKEPPPCRELLEELNEDARLALGLVEFATGLYGDRKNKLEAYVVMAFVQAVRERLVNVVDSLEPITHEHAPERQC
jgi:hypothetical protein